MPVGVEAFDQGELVCAGAGLDLLLAGNGSFHVTICFEIYEAMNAVLARETGKSAFSVFLDTFQERVGHSDV